MAETNESVRKDSQRREDKQMAVTDWGGRRFIPPRGSTLPTVDGTQVDGEVFMYTGGSKLQLYVYDETAGNWSTIGPRT